MTGDNDENLSSKVLKTYLQPILDRSQSSGSPQLYKNAIKKIVSEFIRVNFLRECIKDDFSKEQDLSNIRQKIDNIKILTDSIHKDLHILSSTNLYMKIKDPKTKICDITCLKAKLRFIEKNPVPPSILLYLSKENEIFNSDTRENNNSNGLTKMKSLFNKQTKSNDDSEIQTKRQKLNHVSCNSESTEYKENNNTACDKISKIITKNKTETKKKSEENELPLLSIGNSCDQSSENMDQIDKSMSDKNEKSNILRIRVPQMNEFFPLNPSLIYYWDHFNEIGVMDKDFAW